MWSRRAVATWEVISWRPTTMFSDHENPSNAAAAAAAAEANATEPSTPEQTAPPATEQPEGVSASAESNTPAAPVSENADAAHPETPVASTAEAASGATAEGAAGESAAADEEAAGSEEMSKLMQEFDEKQEAAASHEVVEVKVVAYTEHGVVVDLGG